MRFFIDILTVSNYSILPSIAGGLDFSFTFSKLITPLLSPQIEPNQSHLIKQMPETRINTGFRHFSPLFKLFFRFDFLCYFIVIMFQNRIILIRFCILLIWFQSCCTQIVPNTYKPKIIYIKDYIGTPSKSSSIIC